MLRRPGGRRGSASRGVPTVGAFGPPVPDAQSAAAASVGTFATSAKRLTVTGSGPDLTIGTTIICTFMMHGVEPAGTGAPFSLSGVAESILTNCTNTTGWDVELARDGTLKLVVITGVQTPHSFPERVAPGLNSFAISVVADGSIRASLNGGAAFELVATGFSYSAAGGTAQYVVGGINTARVANGQPLVDGEALSVSVLPSALTDAALKAAAGQINTTNRYSLSATVTGGSPVSAWQATDWDGSSGTTTAGLGSSPTTWTVAGAPAKNIIESELIYNIKTAWAADAGAETTVTYQSGSGTYKLRNAFARIGFTCSNPSKIVVDVAADTLPGSSTLGLQCTGLKVGNVPQGVGRWVNEVGLLRSTDWLAGSFDSGGSQFEIIDGIHSLLAANGTKRGCSVQAIRVPASTPILTITTGITPPVNRFLWLGDSIVGNGNATAPCTAGWTTLMRTNMLAAGTGSITIDADGFGAWKDQCVDAATITASVARVVAQLNGTSSNKLIVCLGTNDYGLNEWAAATFQTQVAAWFDAFHAAAPAVTVLLITPLSRSSEVANGSGSTLGDYRTALSTIQSTRSAYITLLSGPTLMPTTLLDAGGVHPTQVGHAQLEFLTARSLGYTPQQPWLSNGTVYASRYITHVFVADSSDVGGVSPVPTWTARKGGVNAVQATGSKQPTFSATGWAATINVGALTFDGVDDFMSAHAIASALSGDDTPQFLTIACSPLTLAVTKQLFSFSKASTATQSFDNFSQTATNKMLDTRTPDSGAGSGTATTQSLDSTRQVFTRVFVTKLNTIRRNGVDTSQLGITQDVTTMTLDQCTIACFLGGGTAANFSNLKVRAILGHFDGTVLPPVVWQINEGYLLGEAT